METHCGGFPCCWEYDPPWQTNGVCHDCAAPPALGFHRGRSSAGGPAHSGRRTGRLAVDQPARSLGIEAHHPVANDLEADAADAGPVAAGPAIVDRRQRQQTARLVGRPGSTTITAAPSQAEGPVPAVHGVVRWRLCDLAQWVWDEFRTPEEQHHPAMVTAHGVGPGERRAAD